MRRARHESSAQWSSGPDRRHAPGPGVTGILDGVLVADFSRVLAGPMATAALGDLGATVIKIERPGGDDTRSWGPPFTDGESAYFTAVNRNKRSIVLDLKDPRDRSLARRIVERADVLVENFRPGVAERLGLGYDDLRAANPRLVYASISAFGRNGPAAALPGYDFVIQAVSGLMSITGPADADPVKTGVAIVDVLTGLHVQAGVLAALYRRAETGQGQRLDVSLLGSALGALVNQASSWLNAGVRAVRDGNRHPSIAPYETLHTADGQIALAVGNDEQFARLTDALGRPELAEDIRFARNPARVVHRDELVTELESVLRGRSSDHWISAINAAGVACGRVNSIAEAFSFAADLDMAVTTDLTRTDSTVVRQVANPLGFSDTPVSYRLAPPRLAEHDEEIRAWLEHGTDLDAMPHEGKSAP
jgi:crotonobetainyl-CoA:carnitine CoA-transferase CaiB-like acyl-CoA transferase